jgi:hypothetical protein
MNQEFIDYVTGRVQVEMENSPGGNEFLQVLKNDPEIIEACIVRFLPVWARDYMVQTGIDDTYDCIQGAAILRAKFQERFADKLAKIA